MLPTPAEQTEGLTALNGLLLSPFGFTIGNQLLDWTIPARQRTGSVTREYPLLPGADFSLVPTYPTYPPLNSRILWDKSPQHVYFDESPEDGAVMGVAQASGAAYQGVPGTLTLDGNGRTIAGQPTLVLTAPATPTRWFYRADVADWRAVVPLLLADDCLFSQDLDDLWITALSIRLSPRYGKTVQPATGDRYKDMMAIFRTRFQQSAPTSSGGEDMMPTYESFSTVRWMQ